MASIATANRTDGSHDAAESAAAPRRGVSVVTPLFNERQCVDALVESLRGLQRTLGTRFDFEFVLVDDGSTDGTVQALQEMIAGQHRFRLLEHGANRGIAAAIHSGIRAARHETVVSMDCDGSYEAALLGELVPLLTGEIDLVTASPYHPLGTVENVPAWRLQLSRLASRLYGVVCRKKLTCYTSCFRVYRRSAIAPIELENERFVGVAELLWKVLERGGGVAEHPARLRSRVAGQSKMRVARVAAGHLRLMSRIARQRLRGNERPCSVPSVCSEPAATPHAGSYLDSDESSLNSFAESVSLRN